MAYADRLGEHTIGKIRISFYRDSGWTVRDIHKRYLDNFSSFLWLVHSLWEGWCFQEPSNPEKVDKENVTDRNHWIGYCDSDEFDIVLTDSYCLSTKTNI